MVEDLQDLWQAVIESILAFVTEHMLRLIASPETVNLFVIGGITHKFIWSLT